MSLESEIWVHTTTLPLAGFVSKVTGTLFLHLQPVNDDICFCWYLSETMHESLTNLLGTCL